MKVTSVGHAGLYIETTAGTVLCDPWVNPAYYASWFPFPDNSGLDWDHFGRADYLYVSHLHHDHFDPDLLRTRVSKRTTVLLPDFPVEDLADALHDLGFTRFVTVPADGTLDLDGLRVMITALTSPSDGPLGDSALALDDGTASILNQNDARPLGFEALHEFAGPGGFSAHLLQFSGAIWWPMVYDLPERAKAKIGAEKRLNGMERALRYTEKVGAAHVIPIAGPPCFLDDDLIAHNDTERDPSNIFPDAPVFLDFMAERGHTNGHLTIPGSTAEILAAPGGATCTVTHPIPADQVATIFTEKAAYLAAYAGRQRARIEAEKAAWAVPGIDVLGELKSWFEPLLELAEHFRQGIGYPVQLLVTADPTAAVGTDRATDLPVVIDFPEGVVRLATDDETCRYRFRVARPLVERLIADHEIDWVNTLFLGLRFEAHRAGSYNEYLYSWFKCLKPDRLEYCEGWYAERVDGDEEITLGDWCMQRRCPHLKADLGHFGVIEDTTLTCTMHGWKWDLTSGECLTSAGHELRVRPAP